MTVDDRTDEHMRVPAEARETSEDIGRNPSGNDTLGDVIAARYARRDILKGALGVAAISATASWAAIATATRAQAVALSRYNFTEVTAGVDDNHRVAEGYDADVLMRWGDAVLPDAPPFDPRNQTSAAQKLQFGYNSDYLGYLPMPNAENPSQHGLLVVNHEYTNEELMFPGLVRQDVKQVAFAQMTRELAEIEQAAHGGSVLEIRRVNEKWRVVENSRYARRINADTPMRISGPAAGHVRMKTSVDPTGTRVHGMLNNCAGGITPWGTWLTCEENIHGYFWDKLEENHTEYQNHRRMGVPARWFNWGQYEDRFDVNQEPNEANRFGWIVEIDPFDPASVPKKRTALGRAKHEGAAGIVNKDGRYVVYSGDDERFEYIYRFVTAGRVNPSDIAANRDLLDDGTLSAARYNADGGVEWLPLVYGKGPLTEANGFSSQADVVIETRRAADLVGATKMDRPEDVEANPITHKVYAILTNNSRRKPEQTDAANPRAPNRFGHIIEMTPPDGDHAADRYTWEILLKCGDPAVAAVGATFNPATTVNGWFAMPDNCAIDNQGRLWIATDGNSDKISGRTDGMWGLETDGALRGTGKLFYGCPVGAELCGPFFTPDDQTLFVAVQHPGEASPLDPDAPPSTFDKPSTRWPDFKPDMPPRPSIVAITRRGGGKIAG